ncbi:MAG: hypothetical protein ACE5JT_03170, partial [Nitrosopumilaceae archaeon]
EGLVSEILKSLDFQCTRNFILTRPRMEIDVIGVKLGIAILIDCKHWKRLSNSALRDAVKKQIKRARYYLAKTRMKAAIPTIVTLYRESVSFINKVPIVPIFQLRSFLEDFYGNMDKLNAIKA